MYMCVYVSVGVCVCVYVIFVVVKYYFLLVISVILTQVPCLKKMSIDSGKEQESRS